MYYYVESVGTTCLAEFAYKDFECKLIIDTTVAFAFCFDNTEVDMY